MEGISFINIGYFFVLIYDFFTRAGSADYSSVPPAVIHFWDLVKVVSTIVTLILLTGTVYAYIRLRQIKAEEKAQYEADRGAHERIESEHGGEVGAIVGRWDDIVSHLGSSNPNDWKLAVIEADILLDEILRRGGYHGDSLGERLQGVERSDFETIDLAWEGHKIRNRIAHEGVNFNLSHEQAKRAIACYQQVFREFQYL